MTGPNWKLEDDQTTLTITFPSIPPVALVWTASAVDEHFEKLGELRATMTPEIPKTWALGQTFLAVPDPAWMTEPDALIGNSILHIRDPRFGWLHYMIPREGARQLARYLQTE
jgi:hypothetical protein